MAKTSITTNFVAPNEPTQVNNHGRFLFKQSVDRPTDPCIKFVVKTLTCDISINEEHKVDNVSLEEFWMDPCIEFAFTVETLEGEILVGEDISVKCSEF